MAGKWLLVAEKPSQSRSWAKALGGMSGTYQGQAYVVTNALGHLFEQASPEEMVAPDLKERYKSWDVANLPWDETQIMWKLKMRSGVSDVCKAIKAAARDCDTVCFAGDLDPSGEGGMITYEIIKQLNLTARRYLRLEFADESPKSLQKAFTHPVTIPDIDTWHEVRKAQFRSRWDFIGGLQWTRMATRLCGQRGVVLRNGRLKSAIVVIVGDQLKAIEEYVRKPFFQNRFKDENGVVYTNPDEPTFDTKDEVPNTYHASAVVCDSKTMKRTAPPKLIDLATLAGRLAPLGIKSDVILSTYQKMYEAQVVSYPRTEDKKITKEQFDELLPLVNDICRVVGVDPALVSQRTPRKTHIGDGMAHGANRPGTNVPKSLSDLDAKFGKGASKIYEVLAKSYLAMMCPDYEYEQQKGHVSEYPAFVGSVNVPKVAGWRAVFDDDADDVDEASAGLGTMAEPFVHEGANAKPQQPTVKWLMAQLGKYGKNGIGTGATRTSTVAEITKKPSSAAKFKSQILEEKRGKLSFAECGQMSYLMLKGTHIADLAITEHVEEEMRLVADGKLSEADGLHEIQAWIRDDIQTMTENAKSMQKTMGLTDQIAPAERASGTWSGREVTFKREFSGHRFTDDEVSRLLAGQSIKLMDCVSAKTGRTFRCQGKLEEGTFKGKKFVGFKAETFLDENGDPVKPRDPKDYITGMWKRKQVSFKRVWAGHTFTDEEGERLLAGETIHITGCISKAGKSFDCDGKLATKKWEGKTIVCFEPDFGGGGSPKPKGRGRRR